MISPLLTEKEVMTWLQASRSKMQRLRKRRVDPIPFMVYGHEFRFDPEEVKKWLSRQTKRWIEAKK